MWLVLLAGLSAAGAEPDTRSTPLLAAPTPTALPETTRPYRKLWAVVVGISDYELPQIPDLKYADDDAWAMATLLRQHGFEVITLEEEQATLANVKETLERVGEQTHEDDLLVLFWAGHGASVTLRKTQVPTGVLMPHDSKGSDTLASNYRMEDLKRDLDEWAPAKHKLLLLDTCYGGAVRAVSTPPRRPSGTSLMNYARRPVIETLTAGSDDEEILDAKPGSVNSPRTDGRSVFTRDLISRLRDVGEIRPVYEVAAEVQTAIVSYTAQTANKQTPQYTPEGQGRVLWPAAESVASWGDTPWARLGERAVAEGGGQQTRLAYSSQQPLDADKMRRRVDKPRQKRILTITGAVLTASSAAVASGFTIEKLVNGNVTRADQTTQAYLWTATGASAAVLTVGLATRR